MRNPATHINHFVKYVTISHLFVGTSVVLPMPLGIGSAPVEARSREFRQRMEEGLQAEGKIWGGLRKRSEEV